jgi:hypothetical protein
MTSEPEKKGPSTNKRPENQRGSTIAIWIPIGAGFGIPLGLIIDNLALGIAIGTAIGTAIGAATDQRRQGAEIESDGNQKGRLRLAAGMGILLLVGAAILVLLLLK